MIGSGYIVITISTVSPTHPLALVGVTLYVAVILEPVRLTIASVIWCEPAGSAGTLTPAVP